MPTVIEAKEAADRGAIQQARLMYEAILQEDETNEAAWIGLAEVLTEPEEKRDCYQQVLQINPRNHAAKQGLREIDSAIPDWVQSLRDTSADDAVYEDEPFDEEPSPTTPKTAKSTSSKKKPSRRVRKKKKKAVSPDDKVTGSMLYVALAGAGFLIMTIIVALVIVFLL